ncbi:MAG: Ldh family oxidoreductase [SAR202 cluster bacterium]|nr:Ldh family oxidoreductase [SAR202 cluster bacterium]
MLEQFKVQPKDQVIVSENNLRETVEAIFSKMGLSKSDIELAADVLIKADMRGVETHGVSNMLRSYVTGYGDGDINPTPNWQITRETPSTANIDGDKGIGIVMAARAMDIAIEKAEKVGMGVVTIHNSRHLGMASYHALRAAEKDMIGMCMTSCPPSVLPTWGSEPLLGTNPIAVAAPGLKEGPFVFDAAMSAVAGNKLGLARRNETRLLGGWVADSQGNPIMNEVDPPPPGYDLSDREGGASSYLLPVGGTRELGSHKGYGFMCVVDILGGIMSGGGYGINPGRPNFGHYVAAYNIEAFMDTGEFKETLDEFLTMLKTSKPAPGHDRVMYPGLPEVEEHKLRSEEGIPLHYEVVEWFEDIWAELSIPMNWKK